jgi:hypothetical protein
LTMPQVLVVTYWAIKDICPDQVSKGVHEFWSDDVNNPPPDPQPGDPSAPYITAFPPTTEPPAPPRTTVPVSVQAQDPAFQDKMKEVGFLDSLNTHNIRYGGAADGDHAVEIGKQACESIDNGTDPIAEATAVSNKEDLSMDDAETLVGAAIGSFCDWDQSKLH